ncbi:hypothetical protein ABNF65_11630 [Paenibacillus larvae]
MRLRISMIKKPLALAMGSRHILGVVYEYSTAQKEIGIEPFEKVIFK